MTRQQSETDHCRLLSFIIYFFFEKKNCLPQGSRLYVYMHFAFDPERNTSAYVCS